MCVWVCFYGGETFVGGVGDGWSEVEAVTGRLGSVAVTLKASVSGTDSLYPTSLVLLHLSMALGSSPLLHLHFFFTLENLSLFWL